MMKEELLILLSILPVAIICKYIYDKDKEKESTGLLVKLLLSGIGAALIVIIINILFQIFLPIFNLDTNNMSFLGLLIYTFLGIALLEEGTKLFMTYFIGYKNKEFDETYDVIIYSIFTSLGFALFENILYVFDRNSISVGILRGLLSVPSHACDALFMGYYLSLAKISSIKNNKKLENKNILKSLLIPTILHGIYDFCAFSGNDLLILIFLIFVVFIYIVSINKLNYVVKNNKKIIFKNKFCPKCGNKVNNNFCINCGQKQV